MLEVQRARLTPMPHITTTIDPFTLAKKTDTPCKKPDDVFQKAFPLLPTAAIEGFLALEGTLLLANVFAAEASDLTKTAARRKLADCDATELPFIPIQRQSLPPASRVTRLLKSHCSRRRA